MEGTISKLMLELECGGNVRLEEGQAGDVWLVFVELLKIREN